MATKIFELVERTPNEVIIKVNDELTNLDIARNPFLHKSYDYITVTRGEDHVLTVIKKDGITFNFHRGHNGYTLISAALEKLQEAVVNFIEQEEHIMLALHDGVVTNAHVYFNPYYNKWQLSVTEIYRGKRYDGHLWRTDIADENDMMTFAESIIGKHTWKKTANKNVTWVWEAEL